MSQMLFSSTLVWKYTFLPPCCIATLYYCRCCSCKESISSMPNDRSLAAQSKSNCKISNWPQKHWHQWHDKKKKKRVCTSCFIDKEAGLVYWSSIPVFLFHQLHCNLGIAARENNPSSFHLLAINWTLLQKLCFIKCVMKVERKL